MKLSDAVWETCDKCGTHLKMIKDEVWGCDNCGKEITNRLELLVFHSDRNTDELGFCCWGCLLAGLKKVKTDDSVALPGVYYDDKAPKGQGVKDFWKAMKEWGK